MRLQLGEFRERVKSQNEKIVLRAVGRATDQYKDDHWLKPPAAFETEELFYEAFFDKVQAATGRTRRASPSDRESEEPFTGLVSAWRRGRGDPELAFAVYYYLCYEVSDQSYARAIGQAVFQDPTFVPPAPKTRPSVSIGETMLPRARNAFFGRQSELDELLSCLSSPAVKVVQVVAPGGLGKTSLVVELLAVLASENYRDLDYVFEWTFYRPSVEDNDVSVDPFFHKAVDFFGAPPELKDDPSRVGKFLSGNIARKRALLVIDGLEALQYGPGSLLAGHVKDAAIRSMLSNLAKFNDGLCIVTTRMQIEGIGKQAHTIRTINLGPLEPDSAAALLVDLGVKGNASAIRSAAHSVLCNPMPLALLGTWLREKHRGDVTRYKELNLLDADAQQGGHAKRVLESYHRWLQRDYLETLQLVGFFDRPAWEWELVAIADALKSAGRFDWVSGDTASSLRERLDKLAELHLIYEIEPTSYHVDCHPIVREFERSVARSTAEVWRIGNETICDKFLGEVRNPPETRSEFLRVYDALHHAVEAGKERFAFEDLLITRLWRNNYISGEPIRTFHSTSEIGLLNEDLRAIERFFLEPFVQTVPWIQGEDKRALFSQAGFLLSSLLRFKQSLQAQKIAYELAVEAENWEAASIASGSPAEYSLAIGEMAEAQEFARRAIAANASIERDHPHRARWTIAGLCTAGMIEHEAGDWEAALLHFENAIALNERAFVAKGDKLDSQFLIESRYVPRAGGYYLLSSRLHRIEKEIWDQRDNVPRVPSSELDAIVAWANFAMVQKPNAVLYDAWFQCVAGIASLLNAFVVGLPLHPAITTIRKGVGSFNECNIDRMTPIGLLAMAMSQRYLLLCDPESREVYETSFYEYMEEIRQICAYGPLVLFDLQAELEQAKMNIELARLRCVPVDLSRIDHAIERALHLKYYRILSDLEDVRKLAIRLPS